MVTIERRVTKTVMTVEFQVNTVGLPGFSLSRSQFPHCWNLKEFHENCKCQKHLNHFLRLFGSVQLNNDLWRNGKNIISFFGKNVKNNLHLFVDAFLTQRLWHLLCSKHFVGDQWFELWWNLINLLLNLLLNWHSRVVNYDRKVLYKIDHGNKFFSITIVLI